MSTFSLHCEKCTRDLNETATEAMQLVALFKPSRFGRLAKTHEREVRHRCLHCGFVNVFHPLSSLTPPRRLAMWRDDIMLKA